MEWEQIDNSHKRAKITGGWLVKAYEERYTDIHGKNTRCGLGYEWQVSMCFVPDEGHYWKVEK